MKVDNNLFTRLLWWVSHRKSPLVKRRITFKEAITGIVGR